MQYVNGFDISAQGITEILAINEKVNLPKISEKDGVSVYEKATEMHYVGKSQAILHIPPEFVYTQVRSSDYCFLPGCIEHKVIEQYNFDNQVTLIRIRTPSLEGRSIEYCKFMSCYANLVKRVYVVAFQGIRHDQVQYSEGALVVDMLPSGYIIDVPPSLGAGQCRFTLVYQVAMSSFVSDGLGFTRDQVIDCVQREHRAIYIKFKQHVESVFYQSPPDTYSVMARHTYHAWLDVMGSLGPAQGWTCQVQKYGLSIYSKRCFADLIVATRIVWAFDLPPSIVRDAFSLVNVLRNFPNVMAITEDKLSDTISVIRLEYPSLYIHDSHKSELLLSCQDIGERHIATYCTIAGLNAPYSLPSGILVMPTAKGGTQLTMLTQSCFPNNYLPWPDLEAMRIINGTELGPLRKIRDKLINHPELPRPPLPGEIEYDDQFQQLVKNYSNMILKTFDEKDETTAHADRFDSLLEKRKRTEAAKKPVLEAISSREISLAPMGKGKGEKPFLFLMSSRRKFRRVTKTTSNTSFDGLSSELLTRVTELLDINSVLSLSATCRFFTYYIHSSAMTWYHQYTKKWEYLSCVHPYTDWRESYLHKVAEENGWRAGGVKIVEWGESKARLRKVIWDNSGLVFSCSIDKSVKVWHSDTNSVLSSVDVPGMVSLCTLPITSHGLQFVTPHKNGVVEWWEYQADKNQLIKLRDTRYGHSLKDLLILEEHTITWDNEIVKVWDNQTGLPISVSSDHQAKITCVVAFGKYYIVASANGTMSMREMKGCSSAAPAFVGGHSKSVNCLQTLSAECFASGGSDMHIKFWDVRNVKDSFSILQHSSAVRCLHKQENILVSGGDDMKVKLYLGRKGQYAHARTLDHEAKIHHVTGHKNSILIGDSNGLLKKYSFEDVD